MELKRALQAYGHEFDITDPRCSSFQELIKSFKNAMKQLKQKAKALLNTDLKSGEIFTYNLIQTNRM